jgi:hypothetical protein
MILYFSLAKGEIIFMMPIMTKIYSVENEVYYVYIPGTEHLSKDRFGNPVFKKDPWCYLDSKFNKFINSVSKERAESFAEEQRKLGKDYIVGPRAPETIDVNGDFVPNTKDELGIWERPTEDQINYFNSLLNKQTKKLELA